MRKIVPDQLEGSLKRQFGYFDDRKNKWCGEDKFISDWKSRLKIICQCQDTEDKEKYIATMFQGKPILYISFERSLDEEMMYQLTCEDLISFADKDACSPLKKRQETNYDHYDFIEFFRSISDAFLQHMKENKYNFFDNDDDADSSDILDNDDESDSDNEHYDVNDETPGDDRN